MIRSLLIGLIAGARSMTPLAAVSAAAHAGRLPVDNGAPSWLGHPLVAAGSKLLAAGELWGDKWKSAPDRIVPAGIAARLVTAGIAGTAEMVVEGARSTFHKAKGPGLLRALRFSQR